MKELYKKLFESEYHNEKLWKLISNNKYTAAKAFEGSEYKNSKSKLMVVGRAMNGWERDYSVFSSANEIVDVVLSQNFNFDDVICKKGFMSEGRKRPYRYITSKFWKLIKFILEEYNEANNNWYDSSKNDNWNQKIVWSNLYKISPWGGNNPEWDLMTLNIQDYIDILKQEIEIFKPERILFVTDNIYLEPCKDGPSFINEFNIEKVDCGFVVGYGTYNGSKIVVCKRPDIRGITDEAIHEFSKHIKETFDK